jgi:hypothetical protein
MTSPRKIDALHGAPAAARPSYLLDTTPSARASDQAPIDFSTVLMRKVLGTRLEKAWEKARPHEAPVQALLGAPIATVAKLVQALSQRVDQTSTTVRDALDRIERLSRDLARERDARRFGEYLLMLDDVPDVQGKLARLLWRRLSAPGWFPAPSVTRHEDGSLSFAWESTPIRHHLDAIVHADGTFEWFYLDRVTEKREGTQGDPEAQIPEQFLVLARHVAA